MKGLDYIMKYFKDCKTAEDVKKLYRDYVKRYHPDLHGAETEETMKLINDEYITVWERLKNIHESAEDSTKTYTAKTETTETAVEFMVIINKLVVLEGVQIDLINRWIWLSGNTYPYKETIKSLGFKWCSNKKMWAWHKAEDASHNRKKMTIDEIKNKYGCETFKGVSAPKLTTA